MDTEEIGCKRALSAGHDAELIRMKVIPDDYDME